MEPGLYYLPKEFEMFKNGPTPASFSFIFSFFQTNKQILQQINVKWRPSSIWGQDSNPRPLKHESSPITTRPALPPRIWNVTVYKLFSYNLVLRERNNWPHKTSLFLISLKVLKSSKILVEVTFFFKNGPIPASFLFYFRSFLVTIFLIQIEKA